MSNLKTTIIMAKKESNDLFKVVNKRIKYGVLIRLDICNHHYNEKFDRLKEYCQKLDIYTYLSPFEGRSNYDHNDDFIDDNINLFKDDALWIRGLDTQSSSNFFLVCYLTNKKGEIEDMSIIKQLFYEKCIL